MECAVNTCGLKVGVIHAIGVAFYLDICPHGAVVGHLEGEVLGLLDGIAAVDNHIVLTAGAIREVILVRVGVLLVTGIVVVLLEADNIHFLTLHLSEDVLGHETCGLSAEHRHVVGSNLEAWLLVGFLIKGTELIHRANVGDAAEQRDQWHEHPVETAHHQPVEEEERVAYNQHRQGIDQHGAGRITCGLDITSEETDEGKHHQQEGDDQHHKREIFLYCKLSHKNKFLGMIKGNGFTHQDIS